MSTCIKNLIQNLNIVVGCNINCSYCYARNNVRRFHISDNFNVPKFFENKIKIIYQTKPHIFLLTGLSDFSIWKKEWIDIVFTAIKDNKQHQYIFLTKRPDLINFNCDLDNVWFGVSVTSKMDLWKINVLKKNIKAKHYHVTFEPLFDNPGEVDLTNIDWIVIGTMTGKLKNKIKSDVSWIKSLHNQAKNKNIPVFFKEELVSTIKEENMVQELPIEFNKVLEERKKWTKKL